MKKIKTTEDLYTCAVDLVRKNQNASPSFLQRNLKIKWEEANELLQKMENEKLIGPAPGAFPKVVYMKPKNDLA